jgi:hypothetical protein
MRREKYYYFLALALLPFYPASVAHAANCIDKACVDVYTQDGQLIIEARKGSGPKATTAPKPPKPAAAKKPAATKKAPTAKPVVPKSVAPEPIVKKRVLPSVAAKPPAPKPKPVVVKAPAVEEPSVSLSDRLSKAIPTGGVSYQPSYQPLVNVPVYFWCDLPDIYRTEVTIIGETIDVVLRPAFTWSFGDGTFHSTIDPGAPFPDGKISHTYSRPGTYLITLITSWNGSFTHNAVERSVTGEIKKTSIATIKVVAAPTRFMN